MDRFKQIQIQVISICQFKRSFTYFKAFSRLVLCLGLIINDFVVAVWNFIYELKDVLKIMLAKFHKHYMHVCIVNIANHMSKITLSSCLIFLTDFAIYLFFVIIVCSFEPKWHSSIFSCRLVDIFIYADTIFLRKKSSVKIIFPSLDVGDGDS